MAVYRKGPGELDWDLKRGDAVTVEADFSISLTGHTATAELLSLVTDEVVKSIPTTVTAAGTCGVLLFTLGTPWWDDLPPGTYKFSAASAPASGAKRHLLEGYFEARP